VRVFVLGSGSEGNSTMIEAGGTRLLVDAGFGPRSSARRLAALGVELAPRGLDAIVVTHQHGDHIGHLESLARAFRCPLFLHAGIEAKRVRARFEVRGYDPKVGFSVGALAIDAVTVPHDAPQIALRITARGGGGESFGIATDVGAPTRELVRLFSGCDAALLEANHCRELLDMGPYPPRLKKRVSGGLGHLGNHETAEIAERLVGTRMKRLLLGHMSRTNNTPERALAAIRPRARGMELTVLGHCVPMAIRVTARGQLDLPFGRP
jgi:phosphoribosyl 1,2-cyclic phosphodiesterase